MLTLVLGFIPQLLSAVTNYFAAVKTAQVAIFQAKTGAAAGVAEAALVAQAQVASKWWFAALPEALIGFTVASYIGKCILYDKVLASFVGCSGHQPAGSCTTFATDALSSDQNWVLMAVVAGYFGTAIVGKFLDAK